MSETPLMATATEVAKEIRDRLFAVIELDNQLHRLIDKVVVEEQINAEQAEVIHQTYDLERVLNGLLIVRSLLIDVPSVEKVN